MSNCLLIASLAVCLVAIQKIPDSIRAIVAVIAFAACVFVCIPKQLIPGIDQIRAPVRSVLRTFGIDQHWTMFVGSHYPARLRITAILSDGSVRDVTSVFLRSDGLFGSVLEDPMLPIHYKLALDLHGDLLPAYAASLRQEIGPDLRILRFERVLPTDRGPVSVEPVREFSWDHE